MIGSSVGGKDCVVTAEQAAQMISDMQEDSRIDLGHSFIVRGTHPALGKVAVFNSAEGKSAFISI